MLNATTNPDAARELRVVDVTEFYSQRGGGVRSHLDLKNQVLCQRGIAHLVIAPGPYDGPSVAGTTNLLGSHKSDVHYLRSPTLPYDPSYHLLFRPDRVRALAAEFRADVLEAHSPYVAAASVAWPLANTVRTMVWHSDFIDTYLRVLGRGAEPSPALATLAKPLWAWVRMLTRRTDATFCATRLQLAKLAEHGCVNLVHLPFGIDKETFHPRFAATAVRTEMLRGAAGPLCVAVGRFALEKRMDIVIDVFRGLKLRHPEAQLVIFGDGPERARLEALALPIGNIRFAGFTRGRAELATALASADVLLHACPYETFGLGVAEAIATGLPAVLPDEGGAAELAGDEFSVSYTSLDASAGTVAALALLSRPAEQRRRGAAVARARLASDAEYIDAMLAHYVELCARRRSPARTK